MSARSDGLLLVLSEPGRVPEPEFHDWYDTEHVPPRLRVPGVHGAYRYRAADATAPGWLAVYPIELAALDTPEYRAARVRGDHERDVVARLATLDRRVYERVGGTGPAAPGPAPLLLCVGLSTQDPDGLDAWYDGEHVPLLADVPGWRRTTRFRRTDGDGPDHLALHELDGPDVFDHPGYRHAVTTPARDAVMARVTHRERRLFARHRTEF